MRAMVETHRRGGACRLDAARDQGWLTAFQPRLACTFGEAKRADLRNFRTLSAERAWRQIVARASLPIVARITADARTVVSELLAACEACKAVDTSQPNGALPPAFLSFERAMDSAVRALDEVAGPIQAVEDIAFLVQLELRQRADRITRLSETSDPLMVIGECDSALRRVCKGLGAVDAAIAAAAQVRPVIEFASELRESLVVRRAYAQVRGYFVASGTPPEDAIESALRGAAARIDMLAEGEVSPLLRVGDRLQLLDLQDRIRTWLSSPPCHRALDGKRLWQDMLAFVEMVSFVNRRQELIEHDREALAKLLALPDDPSAGAEVEAERARLLAAIEGRDDELDALARRAAGPAELRPLLEALADRLGDPRSGVA